MQHPHGGQHPSEHNLSSLGVMQECALERSSCCNITAHPFLREGGRCQEPTGLLRGGSPSTVCVDKLKGTGLSLGDGSRGQQEG